MYLETVLLNFHNDLLQAMNYNTLLMLIDISPAFDCVDHSMLLSHMNTCFEIGGVGSSHT